mgnify:FL=1
MRKLIKIWQKAKDPIETLMLLVALGTLLYKIYTSEFWENVIQESILAPLQTLEKVKLSLMLLLTWIFFLFITAFFIWWNIKLTKFNKRLIKAFDREREFIKICKLKWRVREFEKAFPGEPLP